MVGVGVGVGVGVRREKWPRQEERVWWDLHGVEESDDGGWNEQKCTVHVQETKQF